MFRKTYFAIENRTAAEGLAAIEAAKDHPRSAGGQARGAGVARVIATGEEHAILLRGNCEGGKFADGIKPGEDCPLLTGETTTGVCPGECNPIDHVYANQVKAEANEKLPGNAILVAYHRDELEPVQSEEI